MEDRSKANRYALVAVLIAIVMAALVCRHAFGQEPEPTPSEPQQPTAEPSSPFDDQQELGFTLRAEVLDLKKLESAAISVLKKTNGYTVKQAQAEVRVYAADGKSYQTLRSRCMQIVMANQLQTKLKYLFVGTMGIANSNVVPVIEVAHPEAVE